MYYIYNPETELYYQVTSQIEEGTGLITLSVSQTGVTENPGYIPTDGEVICPIEYYLQLFNLPESSINGNRYIQIAQSVTKYIERYTNNSWVDLTVPEDLLYISACMIRDRFSESNNHKDPRFASESVKSYSYTINQNALSQSILSKYNTDLDMFRHVAFA
jgi:hypothetical protein